MSKRKKAIAGPRNEQERKEWEEQTTMLRQSVLAIEGDWLWLFHNTHLSRTQLLCGALIRREGPDVSLGYLAAELKVTPSYVRKVIDDIRHVMRSNNVNQEHPSFVDVLNWTGPTRKQGGSR